MVSATYVFAVAIISLSLKHTRRLTHVCWRNSAFTGAGVELPLAWREAALVLMSATQAAQPLEHAGGAADFQHSLDVANLSGGAGSSHRWHLVAAGQGAEHRSDPGAHGPFGHHGSSCPDPEGWNVRHVFKQKPSLRHCSR